MSDLTYGVPPASGPIVGAVVGRMLAVPDRVAADRVAADRAAADMVVVGRTVPLLHESIPWLDALPCRRFCTADAAVYSRACRGPSCHNTCRSRSLCNAVPWSPSDSCLLVAWPSWLVLLQSPPGDR